MVDDSKTFLYRDHRGSLADSMDTVQEMKSLEQLEAYIFNKAESIGVVRRDDDKITIEPFAYDDRIGWNSHVVCLNGSAFGFTNHPVHSQ